MVSEKTLARNNSYAEKIAKNVEETFKILGTKKYKEQYRKYLLTPLCENYGDRAPKKFYRATKTLLNYFKQNEPYKLFDMLREKRKKFSKEEMIVNWISFMSMNYDESGKGKYTSPWSSELKDEERFHLPADLDDLESVILARNDQRKTK